MIVKLRENARAPSRHRPRRRAHRPARATARPVDRLPSPTRRPRSSSGRAPGPAPSRARPSPSPRHRPAPLPCAPRPHEQRPGRADGLAGFVHRRRRGAELLLLRARPGRRHRRLRRGRPRRRRARCRPTSSATAAGWPRWSIAAHVAVRGSSRRTPTRCCCRWSRRSTASGLAMIHRLDLTSSAIGDASTPSPRQQLVWMTLGVVLFIVLIVLLRDHRASSGSPTPRAWPASCC